MNWSLPARLALVFLGVEAMVGCEGRATSSPDASVAGEACAVEGVLQRGGCLACHAPPSAAAGLDLTVDAGALAARLLDAAATTTVCGGGRLIDSRQWQASVLLTSVDARSRAQPGACTLSMPPSATAEMPEADLACLRSFVQTTVEHAPAPSAFEPASVASALAKVKLLVSGRAPTRAELEQVVANPAALHDLLEGWTRSSDFEPKLRSFLGTALQQDSVGTARETLGFPTTHFESSVALRRALADAFVDTAVQVVSAARPFTEVVTTRTRSVTTAELVLLAFAEQTGDEIANTTFQVRLTGPTKRGGVPATLRRNGDVWELGGAAEAGQTCRFNSKTGDVVPDVQPLSAPRFLALMFGRVQCRPGPDSAKTSDLRFTSPVTMADHLDARPVTLQPTPGPRIAFFDLPALRAIPRGGALSLAAPRVGFFTTPIFLDNWPTNVDNDFRVTLNQTLSVALGLTFSMADSTPAATEGIALEHAAPDTPCYSCHRLMDPMRAYFANAVDPAFRKRGTPGSTPPAFHFFGATRSGSSVDDLARAVVEHPRFATAWVLKVCGWANSRPCNEQEPDVARLAASFVASNFDFRALVVDTLASPLVTGLSGAALSAPVSVSISRRRHVCAALRARLGAALDTSQVCDQLDDQAAARSLPDDTFARGQPDLVQTSAPGTFHAAALESLCERLAPFVVPAVFPFDTASAEASVTALTETVMGLPPTHPRHDAVRAALSAHLALVTTAGGSTSDAMQSAFVFACTSPDFSGVGL